MLPRAKQLIEKFDLSQHPEGGWYKRIYQSSDTVIAPQRFKSNDQRRSAFTIIYFLILNDDFSAFHKIKSDETFIFLEGNPITIHILNPTSQEYQTIQLGPSSNENCIPTAIIPHDTWFAAEAQEEQDYALINCYVAPGFEFYDFELANRSALITQFPEHSQIITRLTRSTTITDETF